MAATPINGKTLISLNRVNLIHSLYVYRHEHSYIKSSPTVIYFADHSKAVFLMWFICIFLSFVSHAFAFVHCCLAVTCWERADLLALVGGNYCIFVTFPCGILVQLWYLIVSFPDLCRLSNFAHLKHRSINKVLEKNVCTFNLTSILCKPRLKF